MIAALAKVDFELVASSKMNAQPKDQPTEQGIGWQLETMLATSGKDPALRVRMMAIGESNRLTLKFRKRTISSAFSVNYRHVGYVDSSWLRECVHRCATPRCSHR